jgi:hypothetical protein
MIFRPKLIHQIVSRESWLKFKDDVDNALQKKPNQAGFYKNLSDMMHNKMEMLQQVGEKAQFVPGLPDGIFSNQKIPIWISFGES